MTVFEYLLILLSVILSLALAHLLNGIGELMRLRERVQWSILHGLWTLMGFGLILDLWGSVWSIRAASELHIASVIAILLAASCIYLMALWLIPHIRDERTVDLNAHFANDRRLILGAYIAYLILGGTLNWLTLEPGKFSWANMWILGPSIGLGVLGWLARPQWLQVAAGIGTVLVFGLYFASYFRAIG